MNKGLDLLGSLYTAVLLTVLTFGPVWVVNHFKGRPGLLGVIAWLLIIGGCGVAFLFALGLPFQRASAILAMLMSLSVAALGVWIALRIASPRTGTLVVALPVSGWVFVLISFWIPAMQQLGRSIARLY